MDNLDGKVLFAVPKKGRLYEPSVALLEQCDMKVSLHSHSKYALSICQHMCVQYINKGVRRVHGSTSSSQGLEVEIRNETGNECNDKIT